MASAFVGLYPPWRASGLWYRIAFPATVGLKVRSVDVNRLCVRRPFSSTYPVNSVYSPDPYSPSYSSSSSSSPSPSSPSRCPLRCPDDFMSAVYSLPNRTFFCRRGCGGAPSKAPAIPPRLLFSPWLAAAPASPSPLPPMSAQMLLPLSWILTPLFFSSTEGAARAVLERSSPAPAPFPPCASLPPRSASPLSLAWSILASPSSPSPESNR